MKSYAKHLLNVNSNRFRIVIKHGVVSCICATVEFTLFITLFSLVKLGLNFSYIFSFVSATLVGFVGHTFFTFKVGKLSKRNGAFFLIQSCISLGLGYSIVFILLKLGFIASVSKLIQLAITFIFNVLFGKYISFRLHLK